MEINEENFRLLAQYLQQTLSPDPNVRRPAEKFLESVEANQNYAILLLNLVDKEDIDATIRVAGSIAFKNFVKRNWNAHADNDGPNRIHESDRANIKTFIVTLMLKSSPNIQKQLSDAVSIIGKYDFPEKWPQLIDEMVDKFKSGDFHIINGVLQTAHSIFKRYRFEFKSQKLWEEIKLVLDKFAQPLTELLVATMNLAKEHENNEPALRVLYGSIVLIAKVFYSLNAQDLPEFFEDNMETWMKAFHELLVTDIACLHTGEDEEAGILEQLRSQICYNLGLYAQKYDEEFGAYMQTFVKDVWELLVKTGIQTKYDALVSNALQFLSTVATRNHYRQLFEDPTVLASICEKVIIPNMDFRASDEELFEDNPEEYIRRDIEGSDIDTRRRAACDLVKTLSQNFEEKIFEIFSRYLQVLLVKYAENPAQNWRAKDTAIFLVTSLASRGGTQKHGITQTSHLVPLPQFCEQQILPELNRPNVNELPVLKADAIKFIMTFRTLLGHQTMVVCLPQLVRHLPSESQVVFSYAACTIEKILAMRAPDTNALLVTAAQLQPMAGDLLNGLFAVLCGAQATENEYIMKAIMRSFATLQQASMPYMSAILPKLTEILEVVAKNPSRPHFNHYLFETLALAIRIVCTAEPAAVTSFEDALFPIFQNILQQDIMEFMPYVFQMLALLMEMRESTNSIPDAYWALFPCLLSPTLWDRPGNVTPLIKLICAFIRQGSPQVAALQKLNGILGVFQKMIASKANDHEGFFLLQYLLQFYPTNEIQENIRQIFALLFQRLSLSKTAKYVRGFIGFLCFYAAKMGATQLVELIDNIQAQMFGMVLERVLITDLSRVAGDIDRKIVTVGVVKLLCECPAMLVPPYRNYWPNLLQALITTFEMPPDNTALEGDDFVEIENAVGYQAAYSQLNYAKLTVIDPIPEIPDGCKYLCDSLAKLSASRPGDIPTLISGLTVDHQQALQRYCAKYEARIM